MTSVQDIEWGACVLEPHRSPELERLARRSMGAVPRSYLYFTPRPWITRAMIALQPQRVQLAHLDYDLNDYISLVVGQDNSCRYCYAASRSLLKVLGMDEASVRKLEENSLTADLGRKDRLALDFARRISRFSPPPAGADWQALRAAGFGDGAIREIIFQTGVNVFLNRLMTLPAIPTEEMETIEQRWYVRYFRPLVSARLRARRRRGQIEPLSDAQAGGLFGNLVQALDGLPAARALRGVIDDAWRSDVLPRRTKALVFAVVARGLDCAHAEKEATRLACEEGLSADEVAEILANLASPKLDALEALALPFARETLWYRPTQIQRRTRHLRQEMTNDQLLELIGLCSLANMLCRLSPLACNAP